MTKFVVISNCRDYYFKLPYGIETLDDERVEHYAVKYEILLLILKDNDKVFEIEPTYKEDDGQFREDKELEYYDEKDTPFYKSEEEEEKSFIF
tara:strand:- start:667 stop:945 length:279 start_codon:yes stop_codon:yes gene_type:complete